MTKSELRAEKRNKKKEEKLKDKERIRAEKKKDREEFFKVEDPIGFMRIINIISVVLLVCSLFLGIRYLINSVFVFNYTHERYVAGSYNAKIEEFLTKLNIPEGYVPYYNAGNAHYMNGDYDNAISDYKAALESHPTEKKECDIRVNLALAMLHKIDFDHLDTEKQKSNAIRQLQSARNVLVEKGCADPYGTDGHDPEAEQLKQDIDKMLEELGAEPEDPQGDQEEQDEQQGGEGEEKQKSYREQQLEKDLNKQKEDAMEERREADNKKQYNEDNSSNNSGGSGADYDDNKKNW
ncbi:MAG: tetratricopeptide repeat protein [Eubacterium sp.]|nr:tetratricopeptide repeat protein [Eubacterium sp.]